MPLEEEGVVMDETGELTEILSPRQAEKIISHAEKNSARDALILSLMWKCGLKTNEVATLKCVKVNPNERTIVVGKKDREVPVEKGLMVSLTKYLSEKHPTCDDSTHVFVAQGTKNKLTSRRIQNMVRDYAKSAGFDDLTPNHLRKSFAAYFLQKTNDINALREMLGQKDLYTTQRYLGALKKRDIGKLYHKIWK